VVYKNRDCKKENGLCNIAIFYLSFCSISPTLSTSALHQLVQPWKRIKGRWCRYAYVAELVGK